MEVSILNEREQVFKGSSLISAPLQNFTELKEREVSYYKSSDEAPKCDDFVDMYEEDYVEVDEVGINIPAVSKCPTKYFAVEALLGELETPYLKEKAQENLGIKDTLENFKENLSKVSSVLNFNGIQDESVSLQQGMGSEIIFYTIENKFISKTNDVYYEEVPKEYVELTFSKIYIYNSQTYIYNGVTLVATTKLLSSDLELLQLSVAKHIKLLSDDLLAESSSNIDAFGRVLSLHEEFVLEANQKHNELQTAITTETNRATAAERELREQIGSGTVLQNNSIFEILNSINGGNLNNTMLTPSDLSNKDGLISARNPHISDTVDTGPLTWTCTIDGSKTSKIVKVKSHYVANNGNYASTLAIFKPSGECIYHNYVSGTTYILAKTTLVIRTCTSKNASNPIEYCEAYSNEVISYDSQIQNLEVDVKTAISTKSDVFYGLSKQHESEVITWTYKMLNGNAEEQNWAYCKTSNYIELKDGYCLLIDNVPIAATTHSVISFYDDNYVFISDYNKYIYSNGNGKTLPERYIIVKPEDFPLARYARISYKDTPETTYTVKVVNLAKNTADIVSLKESDVEMYSSMKTPFAQFLQYKGQTYINKNGGFSNWGACRVWKINLPLEPTAIIFKKLVATSSGGQFIAFYKGKDEFISSFLTAKGTIENILLKASDIPSDAEYILFYSLADVELFQCDVAKELETLKNRVETLENNVSVANTIIVQGDSISNQIGAALVKNISYIGNYEFVNNCVGGESCIDTLAKNGYYPYKVAPFTIPADTSQSEAIEIYPAMWMRETISEDGETVTYHSAMYTGEDNDQSNRYGEGINPWDKMECTINGIEGILYFKRANTNRPNNYFIRKTAGDAVTLTTATYVIPKLNDKKASPRIVFMGTNGGWYPVDELGNFEHCADVLVNYYETIAREIGHPNYLFLGFYMTAYIDQSTASDRIARWKYFEDKMVEKFGKHYFSVRQYLRTQGWRDAGYQLGYRLVDNGDGTSKYTCYEADIAADKNAIAIGKVPYCIVNGESGVHMLSKPSAAVANEVVKRLYELGIVDEIKQIDIVSIRDAENADINEPDYNSQ